MLRLFIILCLLGTAFTLNAQDTDAPQAGDIRTDEFDIEQVYVPAGCFMMGTSDAEADYALTLDAPSWASGRLFAEQVQHEVCLSAGYWLDRYEVTNAAFQAFVDAGGYDDEQYWDTSGWAWRRLQNDVPLACDSDEDDEPRACITWYEAAAYAAWRGGALPTEAQWEYAARGPESTIYPWGDEWDATLANVVDSEGVMPVGSYPDGVSWVGAHDMAGNVMEWVADWLSVDYDAGSVTDPTGPVRGRVKVEKGGWWGSNPLVARSAYRHFEDPPTYQDYHIGFRIVTVAGES